MILFVVVGLPLPCHRPFLVGYWRCSLDGLALLFLDVSLWTALFFFFFGHNNNNINNNRRTTYLDCVLAV